MYDTTSTFLETELAYRKERLTETRGLDRLRKGRRKRLQPTYTRRANIDA